ncbi:T9SS type A sorting domain-containing protein [Mesonia sp. MT50]|uniref:T9SS type A sorting domain-containing protein n=1 Tax=Mesonia profundi TaxID=3070998 RepID=A0ABU1A162_9FLAO|nr:T9SS type A sorting domain-containing protein [Mesonia profundi]MDQ7916451.1 T9SS type A sorting domain-containing protein [Mesonia profundi]
MKKITLLFVFGISSLLQAQDYTVTAFNEPYQDLVNATSVNNGMLWDDPAFSIPIGFDFEVYGQNYSTLYTSDEYAGGVLTFQQFSTTLSLLAPIAQDIVSKEGSNEQSLSPISYVVEGSVGNRIFKLEYKNAGFWDDTTDNDSMDFQVWLYESDDSIEYRYGPNSINNPNESYEELPGPIVAYVPSYNLINETFNEDAYLLIEDPINPTVIIANNNAPDLESALIGNIPEGTVYRFDPDGLAVNNNQQIAVSVYPNPTQDVIHLQNAYQEEFSASLYDVLGNKLEISIQNEQMDLTSLASGTYFLTIQSKTKSKTIKMIKK